MSPEQRAAFLASVADHVTKIVIIAAVNFALIWIYTCAWSMLGERIVRRMREAYVAGMVRQDMSYFDGMQPGEVSTNLSENLLAIQNGTSEKVGILISSVSYFVASYVVAFILLPVLAAQLVRFLLAILGGPPLVRLLMRRHSAAPRRGAASQTK